MVTRKTPVGLLAAAATIVGVAFLYQGGESTYGRDPPTIRVGVLPDEGGPELARRYAPLIDHLERTVGRETRLVVPDSYEHLLDLFASGEVDLALFGGLTFLRARSRHGARPLVMRDVDTRFTTFFIVSGHGADAGCGRLDCAALRGGVFSFGSRLSTSGHLMPRHFLRSEWNIVPEDHFGTVLYSGAHDQTVLDVREGVADAGAVNARILLAMMGDGRVGPGDIRIVWQSPPYTDYVWAVQSRLGPELANLLRDAFVKLDPAVDGHAAILSSLQATRFVPAGHADFQRLERIAHALGLLARPDP